jgi:hypothetical protein
MPYSDPVRLSVVVIRNGDNASLSRCLTILSPQVEQVAGELIVPVDSAFGPVEELQQRFPQVRFEHYGHAPYRGEAGSVLARHDLFELRVSAGLQAARGDVVGLLQDLFPPDPDWCRQTLEAHQLPHAVIGGSVEHTGSSPQSWAIYLMEFSRYQLPLDQGSANYVTDVNVSYKRRAIESIRPTFRPRYNEAVAHWKLLNEGETLWLWPAMIVRQDRRNLRFSQLMTERLVWGRIFGSVRAHSFSWPRRLAYIFGSPLIVPLRVYRVARKVFGTGRNVGPFLFSFPWLVIFIAMWTLGETIGTLTGRPVIVDQNVDENAEDHAG